MVAGSDEPPDRGGAMDAMDMTETRLYIKVLEGEVAMEEVYVPKDLELEGLVTVSHTNPLKPKFTIVSELLDEWERPWRDALIIKVLGRNVGYIALQKRALEVWKLKGNVDIMGIGYGYHVVRFEKSVDRDHVAHNGPWTIQGHYLTVRTWASDFEAVSASISSTMVWVRFPNLPVQLYNKDFLMTIANSLGKAIKVDLNTLNASRGKFARVCVEIDLNKPLIAEFEVNERSYIIEYENLHVACTKCGKYGHIRTACILPSILAQTKRLDLNVTEGEAGIDNRGNAESGDEGEYGPWRMKSTRKPINKGKQPPVNGQSFGNKPVFMSGAPGPSNSNTGVQFKAGGSNEKNQSVPKEMNKNGGKKFATRTPDHFRDLVGHNIFGDLQTDVDDPIIDLDAIANLQARGKRSRAEVSKSIGPNISAKSQSRIGPGSRSRQGGHRGALNDVTNIVPPVGNNLATSTMIHEVACALGGGVSTSTLCRFRWSVHTQDR